MLEISFYHLKGSSVDDALPMLLEKSLARGWSVVVQMTTLQRMTRLDDHLWSYKAEAFLPHGVKADGEPETQPIYLTCEADNPNEADARFFLERARIAPVLAGDSAPGERAALMFDGENEAELEDARAQWKELRDAGHTLVYYQQKDAGGWEVKAREPKN